MYILQEAEITITFTFPRCAILTASADPPRLRVGVAVLFGLDLRGIDDAVVQRPQVPQQIALHVEPFKAELAGVGLLARMCPFVNEHGRVRRELFVAYRADLRRVPDAAAATARGLRG